jgi:hypothetical protein
MGTKMRFVIGAVALLVLGSMFGSVAVVWPDLPYATNRVQTTEGHI